MIPDDAWPAGDRLEWADDQLRTVYDFLNETQRPYSDEENEAADDREAERAERDAEESLRCRVRDALADNAAFLDLAVPTSAQTLAQVRALTRHQNALARLILGEMG